MNLRNLTSAEIIPFLSSPAHGDAAHTELCKRYLSGDIADPPDAIDVEVHDEEVYEQGADEGQRCERDDIKLWLTNELSFTYADKIEANVIDKLIADLNDQFPDLKRREI
jgi:hypothetical protein